MEHFRETLKERIPSLDDEKLGKVSELVFKLCFPLAFADQKDINSVEHEISKLQTLTRPEIKACLSFLLEESRKAAEKAAEESRKAAEESRKADLYNSAIRNMPIKALTLSSNDMRAALDNFCHVLAVDERNVGDFIHIIKRSKHLKELLSLLENGPALYSFLRKNIIGSRLNSLSSSLHNNDVIQAVKLYLVKSYHDERFSDRQALASIRRSFRLLKFNIVDLSFFHDNNLQDLPLNQTVEMQYLGFHKKMINIKSISILSDGDSIDSPLKNMLREIEKDNNENSSGECPANGFNDSHRWTSALSTCYTFRYSDARQPEAQYRSMFWWKLFGSLIVSQSFRNLCLSVEWKLSSLEGLDQNLSVDAVINLQSDDGELITPIALIEASGHAKKSLTHQHKDYCKLPEIMACVLQNQLLKMQNVPEEDRMRLCVFGVFISALEIQIFKMTVSGSLERPIFLLHLSRDWSFSLSDDNRGGPQIIDAFYSDCKYSVNSLDAINANADCIILDEDLDDRGDDDDDDDDDNNNNIDVQNLPDLLKKSDSDDLVTKLSVLESFGNSVKEYASWLKGLLDSHNGWIDIKKTFQGRKPLVESSRTSHTTETPQNKQVKMVIDSSNSRKEVKGDSSSPSKRSCYEKANEIAMKMSFHLSDLIHERDTDSHVNFVWKTTLADSYRVSDGCGCIIIKTSHSPEAPWYLKLADSGCVPRLLYHEDWLHAGVEFEVMCLEYLEPFSMDLIRSSIDSRDPHIFITEECIKILETLRSHEIIHRDIKPSNLGVNLACQPPRIQLIDYEYCIHANEAANHTKICGTEGYQAPEILENPSAAVFSYSSDVCAMGHCLNNLLDHEIITDELDELIWNMFAPKMNKRYTVSELKIYLQQLKAPGMIEE